MNDSSIQISPPLYIAQWQPSGSDHIIDHLNLKLLLFINALAYVKGTLVIMGGGGCIFQLNVKMVVLYSYQKALKLS